MTMLPSYDDVVKLRQQIDAMTDELTRLQRALPNCKYDFKNMDPRTLVERVADARNFMNLGKEDAK